MIEVDNKIMKFYCHKLSKLVGSQITHVVADPQSGFFGLGVKSPDNSSKTIWFLRDDEGNGPGSFDIN